MVIWFSSGLSLLAWIRPVLLVRGAVGSAHRRAVAVPVRRGQSGKAEEYRHQMNVRDEVSRVAAAEFSSKLPAADGSSSWRKSLATRPMCRRFFHCPDEGGQVGITVSSRGTGNLPENVRPPGRPSGWGDATKAFPNLDFKIMDFGRYP